MRIGVFGDIHANLPALEAVLAELESEGTDRLLCLGDTVGYGASPSDCISRLRALKIPVIAGNHDWGVSGRLGEDWFNSQAAAVLRWTRERLDASEIRWLSDLPLLVREDGITLAHATLHEPEAFDYIQSAYDAYLSFQALETPIAFVGHSHVPATFLDGLPITCTTDSEVPLDGRRAIANPGSVGQPRDEDPRAAFLIYDSDRGSLKTRRVPYDVEAAAQAILSAGLPPLLAERLWRGR